MNPFSHGLPGAMEAVFAPTAPIHSWTALATDSGPLSERMCSGTPRRMNRSESTSMTSIDLSRRDTRMARHSWVNSSMMLSMRNLRPSWVRSSTKSYDQTWLGRSARSRMHDPSFSHRRLALGLFGRDLQPLAPPDPLDPLIVDQPAGPAQQLGDLAIAVAAILPDQLDDVGGQPCLVVSTLRDLALRRAMLTECRAGTALGNRQRSSNMLDAAAAARGA